MTDPPQPEPLFLPVIPALGRVLGRVLLVDDEPLIPLILSEFLKGYAQECVESSTAKDALEHFSSSSFDLVLTDLVMQGMDGLALTAELKRVLPNQKVILISGMKPNSMASPENGGPDAFLIKPFTRDSVLECVTRVMSISSGPSTH